MTVPTRTILTRKARKRNIIDRDLGRGIVKEIARGVDLETRGPADLSVAEAGTGGAEQEAKVGTGGEIEREVGLQKGDRDPTQGQVARHRLGHVKNLNPKL